MTDIARVKQNMKNDPTLSKMVLLSKRNEVVLDVDGDQLADVCLMDSVGDGRVDTLAVDLTGDNEYNLYFMDTVQDELPDVVFYDEKSNGDLRLIGIGSGIQGTLQQAAAVVYRALLADKYETANVEKALKDLSNLIKQSRESIQK